MSLQFIETPTNIIDIVEKIEYEDVVIEQNQLEIKSFVYIFKFIW